MEQAILVFLAGLVVGWLTKVPFMLRWYKQWKKERDNHQAFCNRVLEKFNNEPKV